MVDAAYSRKLQLGHAAVRARWQLIIPLVAAFVLIGGGWSRVGLQCKQGSRAASFRRASRDDEGA